MNKIAIGGSCNVLSKCIQLLHFTQVTAPMANFFSSQKRTTDDMQIMSNILNMENLIFRMSARLVIVHFWMRNSVQKTLVENCYKESTTWAGTHRTKICSVSKGGLEKKWI